MDQDDFSLSGFLVGVAVGFFSASALQEKRRREERELKQIEKIIKKNATLDRLTTSPREAVSKTLSTDVPPSTWLPPSPPLR